MYKFELIVNLDDFFTKLGEVMNGLDVDNNEVMNGVTFIIKDIEGERLKVLECSTDNEEFMEIWKKAHELHDHGAVIIHMTEEQAIIKELQEENKFLGQIMTDMEIQLLELQLQIQSAK